MHVGFVSLDYPSDRSGGGVGNQVRILGRALVQAGHRVTVVALGEPGLPTFSEDHGVRVCRVHRPGFHWWISKLPIVGSLCTSALRELEYGWATYRQVWALHQQDPFDLIEGTETGAFWIARRMRKVPLVIRLHGEKYTIYKHIPDFGLSLSVRLSRVVQRAAIRRARVLISPSQAHACEISMELGLKHPPIEVVPNTVAFPMGDSCPTSTVHRSGATDDSLFALDGPIVLYVGRLEYGKGVPILLQAAHMVLQEVHNAQFVLVGANHPTLTRDNLEQLVQGFLPSEHVHILGHLPQEHLRRWYCRATVSALPSYYETFGLAALESMALGIPVVASDTGGLPEVVEDGVSGLLVPPGDPQALAKAIVRLLRNPDLRDRLGRAGREWAKTRFDVGRVLEASLDLYKWTVNTTLNNFDSADHIFFSPHFDDVVFSCGGLIDSLLKQDNCVSVVTVFAGKADSSSYSAYARHLHAKWGTGNITLEQRSQEDERALGALGVQRIEHWQFIEAPYRRDRAGRPLYASYDELRGRLAADDQRLIDELCTRVRRQAEQCRSSVVLYFPLSLGQHVDHQILFKVGARLQTMGYVVRFYEEWPYLESYALRRSILGWRSQTLDVRTERKIQAAWQYSSQLRGLGGSAESLARRMRHSAQQVGNGRAQERYWELLPATGKQFVEDAIKPELPLYSRQKPPSLSDFRRFLDTLRWHDLGEILPVGSGYCLDIGCGDGRHRPVIEQRGYRWVGMDIAPREQADPALKGDLQQLSFRTGKAAAVVAWQVMEYVEQPEQVIAEVARVLEPGGVFCGSASFLEPIHGRTLYGMSPLLLEQLLRKHGFADIRIQPGLSGFALMLWTWLRRWGGPAAGRFAVPMTAAWLVPLAAACFLTSWVSWQVGCGTGHGMRWTTEVAPLEFAGHVMFMARQAGQPQGCISAS